jgi:hypothetical protein
VKWYLKRLFAKLENNQNATLLGGVAGSPLPLTSRKIKGEAEWTGIIFWKPEI